MTDRYQSFTASPIGKLFVKNLGLPNPVKLERYTPGAPLVDGTVVVGGTGRLVEVVTTSLDNLGIASTSAAAEGERYKGVVFDATGITDAEGLVAIQQFLTPLIRSLENCARVVVLGTNPTQTANLEERVAQRALEGITRSLGKEISKGSTVNLLYVAPVAETTIE
jgi:3-oxoacyl-[acyl-carrier protein] reductase